MKSNVYFEYLNYVLVISHSELTSYNPYTDAFFVSLKRYIKYYIIILNAEFDFITLLKIRLKPCWISNHFFFQAKFCFLNSL